MTTRYEDLQKMGFEDKTWRYDLFDYKINLPTTTAEFFFSSLRVDKAQRATTLLCRCENTATQDVRPHT